MSRKYCIKCSECLVPYDNLFSVTSLDDFRILIKDIYVMTISWCTHVGDVESLLRSFYDRNNYSFFFTRLKLKVMNNNYEKMFEYDCITFYRNYIINSQETMNEIVNLLDSHNRNKTFKIVDVITNKMEFSSKNLNNYIGRPFKIKTGCSYFSDILILTKKPEIIAETGKWMNEIIGSNEYNSIPNESIISIYQSCNVNNLLSKISKTHELRIIPSNFCYCAQTLHIGTKPALH